MPMPTPIPVLVLWLMPGLMAIAVEEAGFNTCVEVVIEGAEEVAVRLNDCVEVVVERAGEAVVMFNGCVAFVNERAGEMTADTEAKDSEPRDDETEALVEAENDSTTLNELLLNVPLRSLLSLSNMPR